MKKFRFSLPQAPDNPNIPKCALISIKLHSPTLLSAKVHVRVLPRFLQSIFLHLKGIVYLSNLLLYSSQRKPVKQCFLKKPPVIIYLENSNQFSRN